MNQRIQELIKQATILEDNDLFVREVFDKEKFAELIVKECAETVLGFRNQFGDSAYAEIKEHFGIK